MNTKVDECKLISGKEALIALANGENIQQNINGEWSDIRRDISWRSILGDNYSLRLKPRTISINGIEVPAPFEPKVGEGYFYLNAKYKVGYSKTMREPLCNQDNKNIENGAWRTEEEIKQVVAALRQIFGASHD